VGSTCDDLTLNPISSDLRAFLHIEIRICGSRRGPGILRWAGLRVRRLARLGDVRVLLQDVKADAEVGKIALGGCGE